MNSGEIEKYTLSSKSMYSPPLKGIGWVLPRKTAWWMPLPLEKRHAVLIEFFHSC